MNFVEVDRLFTRKESKVNFDCRQICWPDVEYLFDDLFRRIHRRIVFVFESSSLFFEIFGSFQSTCLKIFLSRSFLWSFNWNWIFQIFSIHWTQTWASQVIFWLKPSQVKSDLTWLDLAYFTYIMTWLDLTRNRRTTWLDLTWKYTLLKIEFEAN